LQSLYQLMEGGTLSELIKKLGPVSEQVIILFQFLSRTPLANIWFPN